MELIRYDPEKASPLPGGANTMFVPIKKGDHMVGMMLNLDRKGDTGKREVGNDVMLVVVTGEGRLRSGGEIADLKEGDICLLPGAIMHHIWTADSKMQCILMGIGSGEV